MIIKVTQLQPAKVNEFYVNSIFIVNFYKDGDGTTINMIEGGKLIPYLVSETPEQLMKVLHEETFPVERFMEELKDEGTAIPTHVFGHVSVN